MMIKNYILSTLALAALTVACDDYLSELPDNRMELTSVEQTDRMLVSSYSEINPGWLLELYSDNTDEYNQTGWSSYDLLQEEAYYWNDITDAAGYESPNNIWNAYYTGVATCNIALQHIEKQNNPKDYEATKGEALVSRAYNMFMLANVFCMAYDPNTADKHLGLPYPLEPETEVGIKYERGTLAELYAQIQKDLEEGLPLIANHYTQPKFHFTTTAAKAFAARFYLYCRDYENAIKYANEVLGSKPNANLRDWSSWGKLSLNDQVQPDEYVSSKNRANIMLQSVISLAGMMEGPIVAGSQFAHGNKISQEETLQSRGPWGNLALDGMTGYSIFYHDAFSKYFIRKMAFHMEYTDIQSGNGMPHSMYAVFNYDETLMVRAEAYAMSGQLDKAVADLNTEIKAIFSSNANSNLTVEDVTNFYDNIAYYTPTQPTPKKKLEADFVQALSKDQEMMLHAVLHLRRIVTIHDGLRMQDVKRYGITIYRRIIEGNSVVSVTDKMTGDDPRMAIQIPQDVIYAGMTANPRPNKK